MQSSASDCVNHQNIVNTRTEAKFANVWKVNRSCQHLAMGFPSTNWGKLQMFWSQGQIVQSWENKRTNPGDCWAWQPKSEFEIKERAIWKHHPASVVNPFLLLYPQNLCHVCHLERPPSSLRSCGWSRSLVEWCIGTSWPSLSPASTLPQCHLPGCIQPSSNHNLAATK